MPLYTFVLTFRGRTKVHQHRRSNFRGFLSGVVAETFPELASRSIEVLRGDGPTPVEGLAHVWRLSHLFDGDEMLIQIVETKG